VAIRDKVFVLLGVCIEMNQINSGVLNRELCILLMNPLHVQAISAFIILLLLLSSGILCNTVNTSVFLILTVLCSVYCTVVCKRSAVACYMFFLGCIFSPEVFT
jgi:hypothetical protein